MFPPAYVALPKNIKMKYDGQFEIQVRKYERGGTS